MSHGLTEEDLQILREALGPEGDRAWLFGSRARGDHRAYSDVGLLLDPDEGISSTRLSEIREALEESRLPFKVDLVRASDLAASYREGALRDRRRLF